MKFSGWILNIRSECYKFRYISETRWKAIWSESFTRLCKRDGCLLNFSLFLGNTSPSSPCSLLEQVQNRFPSSLCLCRLAWASGVRSREESFCPAAKEPVPVLSRCAKRQWHDLSGYGETRFYVSRGWPAGKFFHVSFFLLFLYSPLSAFCRFVLLDR